MNIGLALKFGMPIRQTNAPTADQVKTQLNSGGGIESARDRVVRQSRQQAAARMVNAKIVSNVKLPQQQASVGKKKGA
jgi:hypothetical protein